MSAAWKNRQVNEAAQRKASGAAKALRQRFVDAAMGYVGASAVSFYKGWKWETERRPKVKLLLKRCNLATLRFVMCRSGLNSSWLCGKCDR